MKIKFKGVEKEATRTGSFSNTNSNLHFSAHFDAGRIDYYIKGQKGNEKYFINGRPMTLEENRQLSYEMTNEERECIKAGANIHNL